MLGGLLLLCIVPVTAGLGRMAQLASGATVTPENARFFAAPLPVMLHILAIIPYSILGAFQFIPGFRRRKPHWHRRIGRLLIPCGLAAALSGLWMTLYYPWPAGDGELLYGMRLFVGTAMTLSILLGVAAIRRRDFAQHGAWMLRGYAIGMGAGTQVFTHLPWFLLMGADVAPDELSRALMMGVGWVINILVAEWIIRRRLTQPHRRAPMAVPRHELSASVSNTGQ
ncbi:MAG: DUF2306 domain-containing protein [Caldilineaceae bacterium]